MKLEYYKDTPKPEMKKYEIWVGKYNLGQGYTPPTEPTFIAMETSIDFPSACFKYELKNTLRAVENQERQGYVDKQTRQWYYNPHNNSSSWLGPYFESEEEAQKTFGK